MELVFLYFFFLCFVVFDCKSGGFLRRKKENLCCQDSRPVLVYSNGFFYNDVFRARRFRSFTCGFFV